MKGYEIIEKISKFSETVYENIGGIFSIDEIPSEVSYNTFLICNQSTSNHPGDHWLVRIMIIQSNIMIKILVFSRHCQIKVKET